MNILIRLPVLALAIFSTSVTTARAVVVTVNNAQYDVTTLTGAPSSVLSTLQSQVWWGDQSAATAFATSVAGQLGFPNFILGPHFAYAVNSSSIDTRVYNANFGSVGGSAASLSSTAPTTFAVAQQVGNVPDSGATGVMLGFALLGLATVRRRLM